MKTRRIYKMQRTFCDRISRFARWRKQNKVKKKKNQDAQLNFNFR